MSRPRGLAASAALAVFACLGLASAAASFARDARAQRFETKRPSTVVVGRSGALAATERVDAQRTGRAASVLPPGPLVVAWRRALPIASDRAPLVARSGEVIVIGASGTLITLGDDGAERARVATGGPATSAAALLADGTVVLVAASGEAIGVRGGAVRFRTRISESKVSTSRVAPLPLEDGGVAIAAGTDLVALDAEGNVRARRALPEPAAAPLVDGRGMVIAISASGAAYGWTPDRDVQRIGTFGGPVDDAAAFDGERALVAVVAGRQLATLDLVRGVTATRALPSLGLYLGPPALGVDGAAYVFLHGPTSTALVAVRRDGAELGLARTATFLAQVAADGGAGTVTAPGHVGPLVDAAGTVVYASPNGSVGAVSGCNLGTAMAAIPAPPSGQSRPDRADTPAAGCTVNILGEAPCPRAGLGRSSGGVVGLAPAGDGAIVVACEGGSIVRIAGHDRP